MGQDKDALDKAAEAIRLKIGDRVRKYFQGHGVDPEWIAGTVLRFPVFHPDTPNGALVLFDKAVPDLMSVGFIGRSEWTVDSAHLEPIGADEPLIVE